MGGVRQPTDLVLAKGRKHLTKAEIGERRAREVDLPPARTAKPPKWLPEELRKEFRALGKKLIEAKLYTELDGDALGRYLVAQRLWQQTTQEVEAALAVTAEHPERDGAAAAGWSKIQERYFKQARACANDMGLTVTSRCRLVVPEDSGKAAEASNPVLALIQGGLSREA